MGTLKSLIKMKIFQKIKRVDTLDIESKKGERECKFNVRPSSSQWYFTVIPLS